MSYFDNGMTQSGEKTGLKVDGEGVLSLCQQDRYVA
jgi:hypothetical protein